MVDIKASIVLFQNDYVQVSKAITSFLDTGLTVKLILLDNSPTDELRALKSIDERIEYVFSKENIGFGSAHNIALRNSIEEHAKYHLVLNPDVFFGPEVLTEIYSYMDDNHDVGSIMPKVLNMDGSVQYLCKLLPTPADLLFRRFVPRFIPFTKKLNERYELQFWNHSDIANIPNLSGCFMFLRTSSITEVGLFDENMFMYMEDLDLTRRVHEKYKTLYFPKVEIYHAHNQESYRSKKLLFIHLKSAFYYFNKWGWFLDHKRKKINKKLIQNLLQLTDL
jgi:GT2 family glycosyltransferase